MIQEDSLIIKNNSFFDESNISYQLVKLYPLRESEERNSYRMLIKLINYTVYKIQFKLECLENCQFADGRKAFEKFFIFTRSNININSLSADIETITDEKSPTLFIDFDVKVGD